MKLRVVSKFVLIAPTLGNDVRQWLGIQSKENRAQDRTLRNPVMKLLREENRPLTLTDWNLPDKYDENDSKAVQDMPNVPCNRARMMLWSNVSNATDKSSKVKMDTRPSSALPRRQFVTSRRAVSVL